MEARDWFVMGFIASAFAAATGFLFMQHSDGNFSTWCAFIGGFGAAYHMVMTYDQKRADAPGQ